jgi:hypothetical protein
LTADSGETRYSPAVAVGSGGVPLEDTAGGSLGPGGTEPVGRSGETDGSLVMGPSLPFPAGIETTVCCAP